MSFILEPSYTKVLALLQAQNSGQSYTKALVLLQAQEIRTILHQGFSKPKNSGLCLVGWLWAHYSNVLYNIMKP